LGAPASHAAAKAVHESAGGDSRKFIQAAALYSDAGDLWAARNSMHAAAASDSFGALCSADAPLLLRASDALARVGEWQAARAIQRALLAGGVWSKDAPVESTELVIAETPKWARKLSEAISTSILNVSAKRDANESSVFARSPLASSACLIHAASTSDTASLPQSSELVYLDYASVADSLRGAHSDADAKLAVASRLARARTSPLSNNRQCSVVIVRVIERLFQEVRISAVGVAAALLEWRWEWLPSLLVSTPAGAPLSPATAAADEAAASAACGVGAVRGTGGWADIARVLLENQDGASGSQRLAVASSWAPVVSRAQAALGVNHSDYAAALIVQGILLTAAGDAVGAVLAQRDARAAIIASVDGNKTRAEASRGYARSLLSTADALVAVGDSPRASKYYVAARDAAMRTAGAPLALLATSTGLVAVAAEDAAFLRRSAKCGKSLVCAEAAARAAAAEVLPEYEAGKAAWAAVPASIREDNIDAVAFSAVAALAASRSRAAVSPGNHSQLEAASLHALMGPGGFVSYRLAHRHVDHHIGRGEGADISQASLFVAFTSLCATALDSAGDASAAVAYLAAAEKALENSTTAQNRFDRAGLAQASRMVAQRILSAHCTRADCASHRALAAEAVRFYEELWELGVEGTGWVATSSSAADVEALDSYSFDTFINEHEGYINGPT
jgi:hypothetical protein